MPSMVSVLTGDLVGSTQVAPELVDKAMRILADAAENVGNWTMTDTKFTRFRGDGWQMLVAQPDLGLRAAVYLIACLRSRKSLLSTRIAIGTGTVANIGTHDLSDASGDAFTLSGRALDAMPRLATIAVAKKAIRPLHLGYITLVEDVIQAWTPEQAEATSYYLPPDAPKMDDIAKNLGISIQAVSQRLGGANGQDLRQALRYWEMDHALEQPGERQNP